MARRETDRGLRWPLVAPFALAACVGTSKPAVIDPEPLTAAAEPPAATSFLESGPQAEPRNGGSRSDAIADSNADPATAQPGLRWPQPASAGQAADPLGPTPATDAANATTDTAMSALEPVALKPAAELSATADDRGTVRAAPARATNLRDHERQLRNALGGSDPIGAALDLAALLADLERHREARHVLEKTRREHPDPTLAVAIAGVQRDLGQRHLAVTELRALRQQAGTLALHPGLLFELAELEWLEGDGGAATKTLAELRRVHANDDWTRGNRTRLDGLASEITHHDRPQRVALRDLFGNLRGADSATERLRTLEQLIAMTRRPDAEPALQTLERRVLAVGVGDPSSAVRARAIQLGPTDSTNRLAFCSMALADRDPLVRRVAATRTVELLGSAAGPLLVTQLAGERDAATFVAVDNAIRQLVGEPLTDGITHPDTAERAAIVERWRKRFEGLQPEVGNGADR